MAPLTWLDRLRIERVAWTLDQRLYDLPRNARIAHRRELRQNLLTAARDIGTSAALRNLGNSSELAAAYRSSEFGDRPRHSWIAATVWATTSMLVATAILTDAANGFAAGIVSGDPHATGTFHWGGLSALQDTVTCTAVNGQTTVTGGGLSLLAWALWVAIAVVVGRLWACAGVVACEDASSRRFVDGLESPRPSLGAPIHTQNLAPDPWRPERPCSRWKVISSMPAGRVGRRSTGARARGSHRYGDGRRSPGPTPRWLPSARSAAAA